MLRRCSVNVPFLPNQDRGGGGASLGELMNRPDLHLDFGLVVRLGLPFSVWLSLGFPFRVPA